MRALTLKEILDKKVISGVNSRNSDELAKLSEDALGKLFFALQQNFGASQDGYVILNPDKKTAYELISFLEGTFTKKSRYKMKKRKY
ncbi:MAG: hypothetical protein PHW96_01980 [Candidatus Nanoarchaeia archaeon]|nr:hypothetical protein [Candidatus Nanoarchaeia archaeon]